MESIIKFAIEFVTVMLSVVGMVAVLSIVITAGFAISYATKRSFESKIENWQKLDQVDGLRFVPSSILPGAMKRPIWDKIFRSAFAERSYVQGTFNGVNTHLAVIDKNQKQKDGALHPAYGVSAKTVGLRSIDLA